DGPANRSLVEKARSRPPRPSTLGAPVPELLDSLIVELLDPDPSARPVDEEIRRRLSKWPAKSAAPSERALVREGRFVGRAQEIAALERTLSEARAGRLVVARVHGSSGIGKTELVRHVLRDAERRRGVVVLPGRCRERESVPYKAFDSI